MYVEPPYVEPPYVEPPAHESPAGGGPLPVTGGGELHVAYWATAFLVAGVGLLGTLRRRLKPSDPPWS